MRPAAWLLPDVALVAACVTLFYCLFLFQGYSRLFRDSDAGWHIRTGEAILATGKLPRADPYSFTRAGRPWLAWEWAADVATGAIHRAAGLSGVALFYAAAIAAGVWLWFRLHWALGGNFLVACAMSPLLLSTCNIHWLARPHVLGWLFLLGWMIFVERASGLPCRLPRRHDPPATNSGVDAGMAGQRPAPLLLIAAISAFWANVHASFFLAPIIALIYAVGQASRPVHRWFLKAAAVSALAPLANPYGYHLYTHLFRYLTDSNLLSRVGEFQSFDFHSPGSGQIVATVILGMIGGTLALTRGRPEHFILSIFITALALRSARALPLDALLLLPIASSTGFPACVGFQSYSARLRAIDARFSGLALVPLVLLAAFFLLRTPAIAAATGFPPDQFPVAAYPHIPPDARLFAPDKFGGYLIYRSGGALKVFFDGRSDLYGAEFLKQYARMMQVRPGWRRSWDAWHFTHALLPDDAPLVPALEQAGWRAVYRDRVVTLLDGTGT